FRYCFFLESQRLIRPTAASFSLIRPTAPSFSTRQKRNRWPKRPASSGGSSEPSGCNLAQGVAYADRFIEYGPPLGPTYSRSEKDGPHHFRCFRIGRPVRVGRDQRRLQSGVLPGSRVHSLESERRVGPAYR